MGDGLISAHIPVNGAVMAILTTYNLDHHAMADLDATWRSLWDQRQLR